ncbi:rhodanese-like domain-containing protein [bacterium]|nr:rhodanese-like domain-containing protein [bacterium]
MKLDPILLGMVVIVGAFALNSFGKTKGDQITADQLRQAAVIDVRTPEEYQSGHYPNAINIPLDQIEANIPKLKSEKRSIIVYCRSGRRSGEAKSKLAAAGIAAKNGINQSTLEGILKPNSK